MFTMLFGSDKERQTTVPQEGDLFKVIRSHGKTFEIRYGFYEDCDRNNRYAEPMEIYPDFLAQPEYTDNGIPFVTAMQIPCAHFDGKHDENSSCEDCAFYHQLEELMGICTCPANRKTSETQGVVQNESHTKTKSQNIDQQDSHSLREETI